tara:strand:- start:18291 stop:18611 length:321 start_codon:yes stop_codon:yes gene_type:complete
MPAKYFLRSVFVFALALCTSVNANESNSITEAITGGNVSGDVRLRYESVKQDNALEDASSLTIRTLLGYTTDVYKGFSVALELEDSRIVAGMDEFSVPLTDSFLFN